MRPGSRAWTDDDLMLLLRLSRRRIAPTRIAGLMRRTVRAVYNQMHRHGLSNPHYMGKTPADPEKARRNRRRLCAVPVLTTE